MVEKYNPAKKPMMLAINKETSVALNSEREVTMPSDKIKNGRRSNYAQKKHADIMKDGTI